MQYFTPFTTLSTPQSQLHQSNEICYKPSLSEGGVFTVTNIIVEQVLYWFLSHRLKNGE